MYGALLEFPEGWGGVRQNPFCGGGMDIFCNYTFIIVVTKTWNHPKPAKTSQNHLQPTNTIQCDLKKRCVYGFALCCVTI